MGEWLREIRIAARSLARRPGFTATCVLVLALGVGANSAIFSVIDGAMLRPLPYPDADRIVWLSEWWKDASVPGGSSMSSANFVDLREEVSSLQHMTPYVGYSVNLSGEGRPERVPGVVAGHGFLSALGVTPALGRDFVRDDDVEGAAEVVILTHELWRDRFGSDRDILGRTIELDATPHTVIGVLGPGLEFPGRPRLVIPMRFEGREHRRGGRQLNGIARLAEGATLELARTELMSAYERLEAAYPEQNEGWSAWADRLDTLIVRRSQREGLRILGGSVALVFLIAWLNLANLLLVRSETRHREVAVRVALGAGKGRLVPHFVGEGVILAVLGGGAGIVVAFLGVEALKASFGSMLPRPDEIGLNTNVLLFALGLSVVAGVLAGSVPIFRSDPSDLQRDLREGARGIGGRGSALRNGLVVGELALAVVLLATAGLLGRSFYAVARTDVGIEEPERVLVAQLSLPGGRYETSEERVAFYVRLVDELERLPGVVSAGITNRLPLYGGNNFTRVPVLGDPERFATFVEWRTVTPGFFQAVGVRLEEGRMLDASDTEEGGVPSVLVTRELSRQLFGEESALGQSIDLFGNGSGVEIVGVVSDLRDLGHERPVPPGVYAAYSPAVASSAMILLARVSRDPMQTLAAVREVLTSIDPDLPIYGTRTLEDVVDQRLGGRRFSIVLLTIFAGVAILLGAIGIYGVMSYAVAQRTREMGVRLALGAHRNDVLGMVLRHGAGITALGLVVGLAGSAGASRLVASQLFQVEGWDPVTYAGVATVLGAVAMLATWVPARRASATDPVEALRHE